MLGVNRNGVVVSFGNVIGAPRARADSALTCGLDFLNDFGSIPQYRKKRFLNMKLSPLPLLLLTVALGLAPRTDAATEAATGPLSFPATDFIIPFAGEGTLDLFLDGRKPETSGINALGRQRLTLQGHSVSSGTLTLNLHFPAFSFDTQAYGVDDASLRFALRDVDILDAQIRPGVILRETAALSAINGVPFATAMSLGGYLPTGTRRTDNQLLTLDPLQLRGSSLPASFAEPFTLSFTLTATLINSGSRPVTVNNSPEHIGSDVSLTLVPATVPEPSTWVLIGLGGLWLAFGMRRRQ